MAAELAMDVLARDQASKTFDKVGRAAQGLGKSIEKTSSRSSRAFGRMGKAAQGIGRGLGKAAKVGAVGIAVLGAGAAAIAPSILGMASNLELMGKKANTVFGNQIGKVKAWASQNANAMGLTSRGATTLAANFADLLIPMGFARKEAAGMATKVVGLSGALAEWSGGTRTAAEVSESLAKAMLGEREELKGLGISISEADVAARLAKKGQEGLTGATLAQAEAIATQELIMEKSTDAQTAFAKGSGTLARSLSEVKAKAKEAGEKLLVAVTPALKSLAGWLKDKVVPQLIRFADWFAGPGKFRVIQGTLDMTSGFLTFARMSIKALAGLADFFIGFAGGFLRTADIAFSWLPGMGPKIKQGVARFQSFAVGVRKSLANATGKLDSWNTKVDRMRDEIRLKGDISDLNRKLASARKQLKDPNLTKTRRAHLRAEIGQLLRDKRRAQGAINSLHGKSVAVKLNVFGLPQLNQAKSLYGSLGLPGYAHGTRSARRGLALVGEEGPELVRFRGGEQVIPAGQTAGMVSAGGSGSTTKVENHFHFPNYVGSQRDLIHAIRLADRELGGKLLKGAA